MNNKVVSIFGTGKAKEGDPFYKMAEDTGRILAQAGFAIANGGYGGTMTAAAMGASQAGGEVIGVTCTAFKNSKPNQYITREIATNSLDKRLDTLIRLGQAYIVLPGGTGTLLELAKVWELKNKGFLEKKKPIILIGKFWNPLVELLAIDDPENSRLLTIVSEPKQVIQFIK
jgi:uncharacterized protein (TIGR00730 family)